LSPSTPGRNAPARSGTHAGSAADRIALYPSTTAPLTPIDITRAGPVETTFDIPHEREVELVVRSELPVGPTRPPEPPVALFTPRPPAPANGPAGWVTNNDYPRTAIVREQEGNVGYALGINADGRVEDCRITTPSGFDALDRATCRLIERRARFRAATDSNGAAVAGTWRGTVSWTIPED
jgi:periplasmic protein TonB